MPRLEGKQRTALSSRAVSQISWSPLSRLKGVQPTLQFGERCKAADRRLSLGCIGAFQSAEWAVVNRLTDTDPVVDQALNDQQSRK